MRQERFPNKRSSKLAPRGDGPFKVLERINDNAYRIELPGEFNVSSTFNVSDLTRFETDEPVLRSKPCQEGGSDEDIEPQPDQTPAVPSKPMTRSRSKAVYNAFSQFLKPLLEQVVQFETAKETLFPCQDRAKHHQGDHQDQAEDHYQDQAEDRATKENHRAAEDTTEEICRAAAAVEDLAEEMLPARDDHQFQLVGNLQDHQASTFKEYHATLFVIHDQVD